MRQIPTGMKLMQLAAVSALGWLLMGAWAHAVPIPGPLPPSLEQMVAPTPATPAASPVTTATAAAPSEPATHIKPSFEWLPPLKEQRGPDSTQSVPLLRSSDGLSPPGEPQSLFRIKF